MRGAHVIAVGAVSALGSGEDAYRVGAAGERPRVAITEDAWLDRAGLARPIAARVRPVSDLADDRSAELLAAALGQCLAELDPSWSSKRLGLAVGSSSGGMATTERFLLRRSRGEVIAPELARGATYFAPLEAVASELGRVFSPRVMVLGACASATLAIGLALRWLVLGRCDVALAGGFDAVTAFVASGFEALRATTASRPRPFRTQRDGMALGDGAGILALAREPGSKSYGFVAGFAASTDAVHLTAPDRTGRGLASAAILALQDAGVSASDIDWVSAHGTATPFNDAAEARGLARALEGRAPIVHPFKAQIGHTLGAAGVLESLAALDGLKRGIVPAAAGEGGLDPECNVRLLETNQPLVARAALKVSSAFGGANAALVLTQRATQGRSLPERPVFVRGVASVSEALGARHLAQALAGRHPHLHRLDEMSRLVISAVHLLAQSLGFSFLAGTGLILGHSLATIEQNEAFDRRRRERGARAVEPRAFPATSPNAAAGECAIAFGLTGPTFAVGASLHGGLEALATGRDLLAAGDACSMLVLGADLFGPVSSDLLAAAGASALLTGACACLLTTEPAPEAKRLAGPIPTTLQPSSRPAGDPTVGHAGGPVGNAPDWLWASPYGYTELLAYLEGLP